MIHIGQKDAASVERYIEALRPTTFGQSRDAWVYRGQPDSDYKLLPSLTRKKLQDIGVKDQYELRIIRDFKKAALQHLAIAPQNDFQWLAVAQHYGVPTRLLDWTQSALVALYFAVNKEPEKDAKVFALRIPGGLQSKIAKIATGKPHHVKDIGFLVPSVLASRIGVQDGLFTLTDDPWKPLEDQGTDKWVYETILVPSAAKVTIRYDLYRLGIHEATLFPDCDGIGRHLTWKHGLQNPRSRHLEI